MLDGLCLEFWNVYYMQCDDIIIDTNMQIHNQHLAYINKKISRSNNISQLAIEHYDNPQSTTIINTNSKQTYYKTVVFTHHPPRHEGTSAPQYANTPLLSAFSTNLPLNIDIYIC